MSDPDGAPSQSAAKSASDLLEVLDDNRQHTKNAGAWSAHESNVEEAGPVAAGLKPRNAESAPVPGKGLRSIKTAAHNAKPSINDSRFTAESADTTTFLKRELETQERIIVTLQRDNESLLREKKAIAARCKEVESAYEHLEAKHSLLLSSQQDLGSRSSLRVANDAAKIAELQGYIQELQSALQIEKKRLTKSIVDGTPAAPRESAIAPVEHPPSPSTEEGRSLHNAEPSGEPALLEAQSARLREFQQLHNMQRATIEKLSAEVERLESEKRDAVEKDRSSTRRADLLSKKVFELERAVQEKKESISELIASCQDSAANAERTKKQEARIRLLEAALAEKDSFTEKAMERLRSDTKEMCARYQETIAELQNRLAAPREESELRRQISVLEKENLELRRTMSSPISAPASNAAAEGRTARSLQTENDMAQQAMASADHPRPTDTLEAEAASVSLKAEIERLTAELSRQRKLSSKLQAELDGAHLERDAQLQETRKRFATQLQVIRSSHNDELNRLEATHRSALLEAMQPKSQHQGQCSDSRLAQIVEEKGYDAALVAMCERLNYLEKRAFFKEEETAHELHEAKRVCDLEKRVMKEQCDLLIEQKNTQIRHFRLQLDELLASLALLQTVS